MSYKKDASKFQNEHPVLKETDVGEVAYKVIQEGIISQWERVAKIYDFCLGVPFR